MMCFININLKGNFTETFVEKHSEINFKIQNFGDYTQSFFMQQPVLRVAYINVEYKICAAYIKCQKTYCIQGATIKNRKLKQKSIIFPN